MNYYNKFKLGSFNKILYICRGLPGSGKSFLAKSLVENGLLLSTDDYPGLYSKDNIGKLHINFKLLSEAHQNTLKKAMYAMDQGISPIVIDNTNVKAWEIAPYVKYGIQRGYVIKYKEPESPWWKEQFKKDMTSEEKDKLAKLLFQKNEHGVPFDVIRKKIDAWDFNIEDEVKNIINK
jgi:predicted kinase